MILVKCLVFCKYLYVYKAQWRCFVNASYYKSEQQSIHGEYLSTSFKVMDPLRTHDGDSDSVGHGSCENLSVTVCQMLYTLLTRLSS